MPSLIFGEPGKGIHKYRIFDIAVVDVVATIGLSWLINYLTSYNILLIFIILIILSIVMHTIFGVKTKTNGWLLE